MSKRMTKQHEPQTVAAAEAILRDLETKRDKLQAFGQELAETRRTHAYAAHATQDADELTDVAATIAMNDSMLASIGEAISEAFGRSGLMMSNNKATGTASDIGNPYAPRVLRKSRRR
jgi:ABC-type Na+ transport system ATPase subunit NatA